MDIREKLVGLSANVFSHQIVMIFSAHTPTHQTGSSQIKVVASYKARLSLSYLWSKLGGATCGRTDFWLLRSGHATRVAPATPAHSPAHFSPDIDYAFSTPQHPLSTPSLTSRWDDLATEGETKAAEDIFPRPSNPPEGEYDRALWVAERLVQDNTSNTNGGIPSSWVLSEGQESGDQSWAATSLS